MSDYHIMKEHIFSNGEKLQVCSDSFSLGDIYFVLFVTKDGKEQKYFSAISSISWGAKRMYNKMIKNWIPPEERRQ